MPRDRSKRRMGWDAIPVASFSDIAFLLIIFFIVVTTLQQTQGFLTDLPAGQKSETEPEKTPTVQLHEDTIRFNDKVTSLEDLRKDLRALELAKKKDDQKVILFEATGNISYQQYFEVMACVTEAGGSVCILLESESEK